MVPSTAIQSWEIEPPVPTDSQADVDASKSPTPKTSPGGAKRSQSPGDRASCLGPPHQVHPSSPRSHLLCPQDLSFWGWEDFLYTPPPLSYNWKGGNLSRLRPPGRYSILSGLRGDGKFMFSELLPSSLEPASAPDTGICSAIKKIKQDTNLAPC